jgi:hypothetical protein
MVPRIFSTGWRLEPVLNGEISYQFEPPAGTNVTSSIYQHLSSSSSLSHSFGSRASSSPWYFREEVLPIFLKLGGDFTHSSAQKVSNFILSSLMVFMLRFMLCT